MRTHTSKVEHEQKFEMHKDLTLESIEAVLNALNLHKDHTQKQKDVYWDDKECTITNLKRGLRVRYLSGELRSVEFKSLFMTTSGRQVVEEISLLTPGGQLDQRVLSEVLVGRLGYTPVEDVESHSLEDVFAKYGLSPCILLNKSRKVFFDKNKNCEVAIDIITGLPPYVEIELVGQSITQYKAVVDSVRHAFGSQLTPVSDGYLDLIASQNSKLITKEAFSELFARNHAWNVLPAEKDYVERLVESR